MSKRLFHFFLFLLVAVLCLTGCEMKIKRRKKAPSPSPAATETVDNGEYDVLGVIKRIQKSGNLMIIQNLSNDQEMSVTYTGATSFLSKSGAELAPGQLEPGDVVEIYGIMEPAITKVQQSQAIETAEQVKDIQIFSDDAYVRMGDNNYRYDKGVVVISNGKIVPILDINAIDEVTVNYVEGKIYSIVITRGHGFIRPTNYNDFIGGTMIVDGETILPVSKKMLVTVPEGTYEVSMKNGDFTGARKTTVERNQEVTLDMSLFKAQPENTAQVVFDIYPKGAELYVNGARVDYKKPVSLKYGKHKVVVRLEGYTDYTGTLDVQSANPTVTIDLAKEEVDTKDKEETSTQPSSMKENDTEEPNSTPATTTDSKHKITVSEPAGASVYLNGEYKGVAPCSFTKVIGSQTITLSMKGYTTKSYTVEIGDDGENISWNFPALKKTEESAG